MLKCYICGRFFDEETEKVRIKDIETGEIHFVHSLTFGSHTMHMCPEHLKIMILARRFNDPKFQFDVCEGEEDG